MTHSEEVNQLIVASSLLSFHIDSLVVTFTGGFIIFQGDTIIL